MIPEFGLLRLQTGAAALKMAFFGLENGPES